jgi:hypothetical protein
METQTSATFRIARLQFNEDMVTGPNVCQIKDSADYARHRLPKREDECNYCHAIMWEDEKLTCSTANNNKFGTCCLQGKIDLPPLNPCPPEINELLTKNTALNKEFMSRIRLYNNSLAFTSSSANVDDSLMSATSGVYTYRINGAVHHKLSSYLPNPDYKPHFSQIYIYDSEMQAKIRTDMFPHAIRASILNTIQRLLEMNNPYVQIYMQAGKLIKNTPDTQLNILLKSDVRVDRTKNKPTCNEIAVLMVDDDQATTNKRDVIIRAKAPNSQQPFQFINQNLSMYDPLAYPLLHIFGEPGWQYKLYKKRSKEMLINIHLANANPPNFDENGVDTDYINHINPIDPDNDSSENNQFVTAREFYAYRLQDRKGRI